MCRIMGSSDEQHGSPFKQETPPMNFYQPPPLLLEPSGPPVAANEKDRNSSSSCEELLSRINHQRAIGEPLFQQRKRREFIPDSHKDNVYWDRRRRNNQAAKRSREKRRINDLLLEARVAELDKENAELRARLARAEAALYRATLANGGRQAQPQDVNRQFSEGGSSYRSAADTSPPSTPRDAQQQFYFSSGAAAPRSPPSPPAYPCAPLNLSVHLSTPETPPPSSGSHSSYTSDSGSLDSPPASAECHEASLLPHKLRFKRQLTSSSSGGDVEMSLAHHHNQLYHMNAALAAEGIAVKDILTHVVKTEAAEEEYEDGGN